MKFLDLEQEPNVHRAMNGVDGCKAVWENLTNSGFNPKKFYKYYSGPEYE